MQGEKREGVNRPVPARKAVWGRVTEVIENIPLDRLLDADTAERDGFDNVDAFASWFESRYGEDVYDMMFRVIKWRPQGGETHE